MHLKNAINTFLIIAWFDYSAASNSITTPQFLKHPETLISSNDGFMLGFFSPTNVRTQYLGIWIHNDKSSDGILQIVWVANRDNPIKDSSPMLEFSDDGNLQLVDEQKKIYWSSDVSYKSNSSSAQLQNTGNLVLHEEGSDSIIWQSFDYPTDSLLPGVKLTLSKSLNETKTKIISWKSSSDPSSGRFRIGSPPRDIPEFFIVDGEKPYWRSGPWNGHMFLGVPNFTLATLSGFNVDDHNETVELSYELADQSVFKWNVLTYEGILAQKNWDDSSNKWVISWKSLEFECDVYGKCGKFAICNPKKEPICECLKGFKPENIDEWRKGNWTNGCVRNTELHCRAPGSKEDKFLQLKHIKVPDYANWLFADQNNCKGNCSRNCSCLAYSYYSGVGCMLWTANLIDLQQFSVDGADLFIRLANSELRDESGKGKTIIALVVLLSVIVSVISVNYLWKWMHHRNAKRAITTSKEAHWQNIFGRTGSSNNDFQDLRLFDFKKLVQATDNFSENNKLGRGGFGPVYKGKWEDGQEIAVKRLSKMSGQGEEEFMNEVMLISKLQHKNLVRLLGCCVTGEEKLLVYELMPNKSLDALLFDSEQQKILDWPKRFSIIKGICRGLLYLHRDSRLRIIHRDLKPSNILLDEELNPKISDFGMARIFGSKQDEADTLRVVGTYGYMSPEYAMDGKFSEKSDVFSLGVLLLEIVSGKRNHKFVDQECSNLLTHAWKLWSENDMLSLINPQTVDQCSEGQTFKCIQVGLLCVQELPADRPDVSALISMLDVADIKTLPIPKQPGFTRSKVCSSDEILQNAFELCSVNNVSMTAITGR